MAFALVSKIGHPRQPITLNEVSEMALAHSIPNAVEAAYRRGNLFEKRRQLMNDWAAYLYGQQSEVIQFARGSTA